MNTLHLAKDFSASFELACQQRVIFYYVGYFSQNVVAAMADAVAVDHVLAHLHAHPGVAGTDLQKLDAEPLGGAVLGVHRPAGGLGDARQQVGQCCLECSIIAAGALAPADADIVAIAQLTGIPANAVVIGPHVRVDIRRNA